MRPIHKALALLASVLAATASAAAPKMTCTHTGKEVSKCCCEPQKDGKMLCSLSKKVVEKCCCKGM